MSGVERIGNHERESAVAALQQHLAAGRLSSAEYEERSVTARVAKTWADLDALFTDLPAPGAAEIRADANHEELRPLAQAQAPARQNLEHRAPVGEPAIPGPERSGWVPEPYGYTITALAPLAAVILFFVTGTWLWFLLIPAVGIIVYGPDGHPDKRARRQAREERRRGRQGN
jgi:hypothetical protein